MKDLSLQANRARARVALLPFGGPAGRMAVMPFDGADAVLADVAVFRRKRGLAMVPGS